MSRIPSAARQNLDNSIHQTSFGTYINEGVHTSEGTINNYQTIINSPKPSDLLCMSSASLRDFSDLNVNQTNSTDVVLPAPRLTLERASILLDVLNPRGLVSFAE